ncbi:hypothetical protein Tco_0743708 [Tanacetum coccineum]
MDYGQLFVEFNVRAALQTCLSSEVKLRLEHDLRGRKKFKDKCVMQAGWLKERDAEIANLKIATIEAAEAAQASELEGLKERNAALEGQVTALKSAAVTKDSEFASSNTCIAKLTQDLSNLQLSCDELSIKASSLEFEKDTLVDQVSKLEGTCSELRDEVSGYKLFKEQIEALQDVQVKVLSDRVAKLDANLMGMALHLDEDFYPRYLTTIAGWLKVGLAVGIDHGNARRDLTDVAVSALLLTVETSEAIQLQHSPEQLMLLIRRLEDQRLKRNASSQHLSISDALVPLIEPLSAENFVGEASTSGVPTTATTTALSTIFIQASTVPPVPAPDHEASDVGPSIKVSSPPAIVFKKETLETTPEHGVSD